MADVFITGMLSGQAAGLTLSGTLLTSAVDTDSGRSSGGGADFTAELFVEDIKVSKFQ